jgi:hypothetical protein
MSIPLDRLYHYIENIAKEIRGDDVLIYRFYPHGSKKIEDLTRLNPIKSWVDDMSNPTIYSYDQEPLDYDRYQTYIDTPIEKHFLETIKLPRRNIKVNDFNIYDKCILLHSEVNSKEVKKYQDDDFIPVYYWSHAIIARDWFRYAQYANFKKIDQHQKTFLIYNRAWAGTREYRLKFSDLLIDNNLIPHCNTSCNSIEPELQIHYKQHQFINPLWIPKNSLESHLNPTRASSCASADFDINDYVNTDFEVVLETLFDDSRIQLTEKILRPIACGQPFLLMGSAGSLKYLKRYGFKTFEDIIDESYDDITDGAERMQSVIKTMNAIVNWTPVERYINMTKIQAIAEYNQQYFFSDDFFNFVISELEQNLKQGLLELEQTNTCRRYFFFRKQLAKNLECKQLLTKSFVYRSRQDIAQLVKLARSYYNRYLNALNK